MWQSSAGTTLTNLSAAYSHTLDVHGQMVNTVASVWFFTSVLG